MAFATVAVGPARAVLQWRQAVPILGQSNAEGGGRSVNQPKQNSPVDDSLQRMRSELKELLGRSPGAREVLPHLAGVEHALKTQGVAAFDTLPPRVLKRAATQLENVLPEPPSEGIAELRSRLSRALSAHDEARVAVMRPAQPSTFLVDEKLRVSEASVSDFMRVVEAAQRKT